MIHVNSITSAILTQLSSHSTVISSGFTVQEGEAFNRDLHLTPWVGVYYGNANIDPHTLGSNQPWQAQLELFIYVQEGSHVSGAEATSRLGAAQHLVLEALTGDKTLKGSVQQISGFSISPFQRNLHENAWLFSNEIQMKILVKG